VELPTLFAVSLVPPIASAAWFYRRDGNREPLGAVALAFLAGVLVVAVVVFAVLPFARMGVVFGHPWAHGAYVAFVLAAIPEELAKYLFLRRHIRSHHCDEPMDGMVYGALVSLGFAAAENVLYVLQGGLSVGFWRAFTAVPLHASCGALMGLALASRKLLGPGPGRGLLSALVVPILVHGLYDWPLMALSQRGEPEYLEALAGTMGNFAVLVVAIVAVRRHSARLRGQQDRRSGG
jgi:RsiW-degrading membrane proteinase PrsW (M82 family)